MPFTFPCKNPRWSHNDSSRGPLIIPGVVRADNHLPANQPARNAWRRPDPFHGFIFVCLHSSARVSFLFPTTSSCWDSSSSSTSLGDRITSPNPQIKVYWYSHALRPLVFAHLALSNGLGIQESTDILVIHWAKIHYYDFHPAQVPSTDFPCITAHS